jgi:thymidylate kinase
MTPPYPPIALIAQLADALEERGVSYCHWKSNTAIARSETGENDLDLLVDRSHAAAFREVLSHAGFSRVERQGKPLPPGKEDYFGYDTKSGRLVHVDAHFQLVLGHDRTKNYRIPLERAFLESAQRSGVFRLPPPELEYIVFLIRMVLKYAIWDEVLWQGLRGRSAGLKVSEQEELADLESRVDQQRVTEIVQEHTPWLGEGLLEAAAAVARGKVSLRERLNTGRRLHRRLTAHARHGEGLDGTLRLARRAIVAAQRRVGLLPQFRFANGGAIVAVIGGDGSGKSTAIGELEAWIGDEFEVRRIHLGKPQWSVTTYGVRGALKVAKLARKAFGRSGHDPVTTGAESEPEYRAVAWLACTARDRYLAYRKARRFADRGGLVISDRFPHPALQSMDVPLISRIESSQPPNRLKATLQRLEHRYHERIELPEVLIVLRVDPETAAKRKTDEPSDYVKRRVAEVWAIDWEAASVPVVDARRPKEEVAAELKSLIWDALA